MGVKTCCGCMTLRTGSIVIASTYMILPVILIFYFIFAFVVASTVVKSDAFDTAIQDEIKKQHGAGPYDKDFKFTEKDKNDFVAVVGSFFGIIIAFLVLVILVQVTLIMGVIKKNACLILTWIIIEGIITSIVGIVLFMSFLGLVGGTGTSGAVGPFLFLAALFCLSVYFMIVVMSHRQEVMQQRYTGVPVGGMNVGFSSVAVTSQPAQPYGKADYPQVQPGYPQAQPGYPQQDYPPPYKPTVA